MYRFVGRKKVFYKADKRYHALMEDQSTGTVYLSSKHVRRAVEAEEYGKRLEGRINYALAMQMLRDAQEKEGGLVASEEAVGTPGITQTPPPA